MFIKLNSTCTNENIQSLKEHFTVQQIEFLHIPLMRNHYFVLLSTCLSKQEILSGVVNNWIEDIFEPEGKRFFTTKHFSLQSKITVKNSVFGGEGFPVIAGPCSVESKEQIFEIAEIVKQQGGHGLRGGGFKPRTLPYDFQGLGQKGVVYLKQAAEHFDLFVVSELMDTNHLDFFVEHVDLIQIGARNMQNFALLKQLGKVNKPILLKRGLHATYEELLSAAEYLMAYGNEDIILCERGIRTFETYSRNTLDISAIPILKDLCHLPIIVDPSHAVGIRKFVPPLAYVALAAGADGLMVEMHTHPDASISDARQTIDPKQFSQMMNQLTKMAKVFDREV